VKFECTNCYISESALASARLLVAGEKTGNRKPCFRLLDV
jgi:hypothetical protein